eukprot:gnl/MRDRNA2_/MRDRNA2_88039_c0_seq1.p1 gnl/MRDRNA2_/MRDRNA2_88039_c0~~gnl/MRDRNA2_/MRDRNA2_88039_c0_seq1.p1  ORF type:complete len:359 (-),score=78.91 gnl/MRDRNA2_/MRDRNA2_88039_c0_seq1:223-1299(-)
MASPAPVSEVPEGRKHPRPPNTPRTGSRPPSRGRIVTPDIGAASRGPRAESPTEASTRAPTPQLPSRGRTPDLFRGRTASPSPGPTESSRPTSALQRHGLRSPRSESPPPLNGLEAFARLTRSTERGEQASVSLLSTCIDFILSSEIDDMGLLMRMLPSILEASSGKLADMDSSCQELTREMTKLQDRIRLQNIDLQEGEAAVARAGRENQETAIQTEELRVQGEQSIIDLQRKLALAEAECTKLQARLDDGLKGDREVWESERSLLQKDVDKLQAELQQAETPLQEYTEEEIKARGQLTDLKASLKVVMKEATESAELRHKLDKKRDEVQALNTTMAELEAKMKKKKKKKGGKGKKK